MRWGTKAVAQGAVSLLPRKQGDALYHWAQTSQGLRPNVAGHRAFLDRVEEHETISGRSVVELGAGWYPLMPLLLLVRGAASVETYDLNHHYSVARTRGAAQALLDAGEDADLLRETAATGLLPDRIQYHPTSNLVHCRPRDADLALSRYVLEHVHPESIEEIHRTSKAWLRGPWIHSISPGDHRAYSDERLSKIDFLRYSERSWRLLAGNRFAYHNRLRCPEYRQIFEASGWMIDTELVSVRKDLLGQVSTLRVAPRFAGFNPRDLVAGGLWFVLSSASVPDGPRRGA